LSRWCGVLEITSDAFHEDSPIFSGPDPFVVRFHVRPLVALDLEKSLPIFAHANLLDAFDGYGTASRWIKRQEQ
jgi:hypothetical protein